MLRFVPYRHDMLRVRRQIADVLGRKDSRASVLRTLPVHHSFFMPLMRQWRRRVCKLAAQHAPHLASHLKRNARLTATRSPTWRAELMNVQFRPKNCEFSSFGSICASQVEAAMRGDDMMRLDLFGKVTRSPAAW